MIRIQPHIYPEGVRIFADSRTPERHYLHPAAVSVERLDFKAPDQGKPHLDCELRFGAAEEALRAHAGKVTGTLLPMPWDSGPVMIWGLWGGRPRTISRGTNSGLGAQNSVHLVSVPFIPGDLYAVTELSCPAEAEAELVRAEWNANTPEVFRALMDGLDNAVAKAFGEHRVLTAGRAAYEVLQAQVEQGGLLLEIKGPDAAALQEQVLRQLAASLVKIAYPSGPTALDPVDRPLPAQRLLEAVPALKSLSASPLRLRVPVCEKIGRIPGACTFKTAAGTDWSRMLNVTVAADGAGRQAIDAAGSKPWYSAVLSQTREKVVHDQPCGGQVWATATFRDHSRPLILPPPQPVEDGVVVDVPELRADSLEVALASAWPRNLQPLEVRIAGAAVHRSPPDGVLRFAADSAGERQTYKGMRWQPPDAPQPARVAAELTYRLASGALGRCRIHLQWSSNNPLAVEVAPHLVIRAGSGDDDIVARIEVAQGRSGPLLGVARIELPPAETARVALDGILAETWMRAGFHCRRRETELQGDWQKLADTTVELAWPEQHKVRISSAPDVAAGTAVWLAPERGDTRGAQKIDLSPFGKKVYLLGPAGQPLQYRIALAAEEGDTPPPPENRYWKRMDNRRLVVNSLLLESLRTDGPQSAGNFPAG